MPGSGIKDWKTGVVRVTGGELAYHRTGGARPALVLSHGLTDNGLCWRRFATEMAPDFDVIMLDARGHGASSRPVSGDPLDPARDLADALAALDLQNPVVMGHSVGARATAAYANAYPDRVCCVVLEDPFFLPQPGPEAAAVRQSRFRSQVARFQAMTEAEIVAMGRAASPGWHEDDFPAWAAAKRQVDAEALPAFTAPWRQEIDRISAPTLIVHGEAALGSLISPAIRDEAQALNPNIKTAEIAGAGHNVRREAFPEFVTAVRSFLSGVSPLRPGAGP